MDTTLTLEMIEAVIEATDGSYQQVKDALMATEGNVEEAINIVKAQKVIEEEETREKLEAKFEETKEKAEKTYEKAKETAEETYEKAKESAKQAKDTASKKGKVLMKDITDAIKQIWETGNASRLTIEKDDTIILDISLVVSTIGLVLAPVLSVIGLGVAFLTEYTIKIYLDDGKVVNVREFVLKSKVDRTEKEVAPTQEAEDDNQA